MKALIFAAIVIYTGRIVETQGFLPRGSTTWTVLPYIEAA